VIDPNTGSARAMEKALAAAAIDVTGVTGYGLDALARVFQANPDLALIRAGEPFARARQILQRLRDASPERAIIAYGHGISPALQAHALAAGASDWLDFPTPQPAFEARLAEVARVLERRIVLRRHGGMDLDGGTVITVLGAQGGVGKTTIAVNLAIALARIDAASVALVDTDTQFGDVALALDLRWERSTLDAAANLDSLDATSLQEYLADSGYGVSVLPAPRRPYFSSRLSPDDLTRTVALLRQKFDYVVLDTNGAFDEILTAAVRLSHPAVLVTVPDRPGLGSAALALRAMRDLLGGHPDRIHVVLNRLGMPGGVSFEDAASTLGVVPDSMVPNSALVTEAFRRGSPVCAWRPDTEAATAIRDLALRLAHHEGTASTPPPGAGHAALRRLVPRLA
jgi:pilus assembly protein CpaE